MLKKQLAALLLAIAPSLAFTQTVGSGTVSFEFTSFLGPLATASSVNPYDESSWGNRGLVNGMGIGSLPPYLLSWSPAGGPLPDIGFVSGLMNLAPTQTVSMRYESVAVGSPEENVISFTPRAFSNVAVGQDFVLGTLSFKNGGWNGGGYFTAENVPTRLDFKVTTHSLDGGAFNQTMFGSVTMVVNSPGGNDTTTLAGQQAEADWIYVTDYGSGIQSRAFRVFDDCCRPPGGITFGSVALVARFNSLDLVDVDNPEGGFLTASIDPLPVAAPVPEPGVYLMLLTGLGLISGVAMRRRSRMPLLQRAA